MLVSFSTTIRMKNQVQNCCVSVYVFFFYQTFEYQSLIVTVMKTPLSVTERCLISHFVLSRYITLHSIALKHISCSKEHLFIRTQTYLFRSCFRTLACFILVSDFCITLHYFSMVENIRYLLIGIMTDRLSFLTLVLQLSLIICLASI